jgi:GAF domain-containing protein
MEAIIAAVAEQLSIRIENLRLTDQTQAALAETEEQARRLALLNEMGAALNTATNTDEIYRITGEHALRIIGGDRASLCLINPEATTFQMLTLSGASDPVIQGQEMPLAGTLVGEAIQRRSLLVLPNEHDRLENYLEGGQFAQVGFQSAIVSPLILGDQVIGTLNVGSKQAQNYGANSISLMRQVSTLLTSTLENQRLFAETQTRAEQLAAVNRLSQAISQQLDREQLLTTINEQIRRIMPADSFIVVLYDADTNSVSYPYLNEDGHISHYPAQPLNPQSYTAQVINSGQVVMRHLSPAEVASTPLQTTGVYLGDTSKPSTASQLFAPLQIGSRIIGVISVQTYAFDAYTSADITLLTGVANTVAVALENVRLFTETQQRAAQLQELSAIETALSQANTEQDILTALTLIFKENPATLMSLSYLDLQPETGEMMMDVQMVWMGGVFLADELLAPFQNLLVEKYELTPFWRANPNTFLFIADVQQDPRAGAEIIAQAAEQNWRSTLVLPLQSAGKWQGLITFNWLQPHALTDGEAFLVDRLLEPVAAVIATRRAQLAQQVALTETEALYTAGAELNAAQTFDDVLAVIRRHTIAGQKAQNISLNYFDQPWTPPVTPEWVEVLARYSELPAGAGVARYSLAAFPAAHLLHPDAPSMFEDVANAPDLDEATRTLYIEEFGAKSTLFVPLVVAGQWVGYINAIYQQVMHFTESDLRRLMALAGQATVAIQNIRLLQQTARKAQREQLLREITAQVRSSADVDTIMKTAVQEIGQALGRRAYIYLGHAGEAPTDAPKVTTGSFHPKDQNGA